MATKKSTEFNFEQSLQELEKIVNTMEQSNLNLDEGLKLFEQGVKLTQQCQKTLKAAEQKVQILTTNNNKSELQDFSEE